MKVLFIGDIVGGAGRETIKDILPGYVTDKSVNLVIANAENAAGGFGLIPRIAEELFDCGINMITMGNHTWDRKDISDTTWYEISSYKTTADLKGSGTISSTTEYS